MTFKLLSLMLGGFVLLKKEKLSICMFCKTEVESPEDIFFLCKVVCVYFGKRFCPGQPVIIKT